MPLVTATARGRLLRGAYVAIVPLVVLAVAGLIAHGASVWAMVERVLGISAGPAL
jgi:hypothetical protein